jgi:hypothetical protein
VTAYLLDRQQGIRRSPRRRHHALSLQLPTLEWSRTHAWQGAPFCACVFECEDCACVRFFILEPLIKYHLLYVFCLRDVYLNARSLLRRAESQMSNQLAVIAGLETEKIQMQVPLLFCWGFCCCFRLAKVRFRPDFIVYHECPDKKGGCQEKLVQVQGRLDELQSGLTEAGVAGKHDLLLLTDQARSVIASSSCCACRLCMSFCACERYLMFWQDRGARVSKAFQCFQLVCISRFLGTQTSQLHERIKQLSADLDHKKNENEIQEKVFSNAASESKQTVACRPSNLTHRLCVRAQFSLVSFSDDWCPSLPCYSLHTQTRTHMYPFAYSRCYSTSRRKQSRKCNSSRLRFRCLSMNPALSRPNSFFPTRPASVLSMSMSRMLKIDLNCK